MVAYKFDGVPEHTVLVRPHGNGKEDKPYYRTMKSTVQQITTNLAMQTPKRAIDKVFSDKGGLVKSSSAGQLPRGRNQGYYLKRKIMQAEINESASVSAPLYSTIGSHDMLFVIMEQCKNAEKSPTDLYNMLRVLLSPWPYHVLINSY